MAADWRLHLQHALRHLETAQSLLALGDRAEALRHIEEAHSDLGWTKRQLAAQLVLEEQR